MSHELGLPNEQMAALRLDDVQLYLSSRGWKTEASASSSKAVAYVFPSESDAEIFLPRDRDLADFVQRVADVVQMLAAVEERSPWAILNDLLIPPADVIRLQVTAPDSTLGLLPLDEGIHLIEGGRAMLLAAACSAHQPQSYYPRQAFKEATNFLRSCRLGQTERGSFVATIMAPVPPQIERQKSFLGEDEEFAFDTQPFARKATLRLMSALNHITNAIQNASHDTILDGVNLGVSANLCDAVAGMQPGGDQAHLQVRMSWSRNRPNVPTSVSANVSFSQTAFSIVKEVGRQLREEPSTRRTRIEGHVVGLRAEPSLIEDFQGVAILRSVIAGASARVQVALGREEYAIACDAHRDARQIVVTGLLHRETKLYRLLEPQDFSIVPTLDSET